jgi:DNA polymerase III subunit beta
MNFVVSSSHLLGHLQLVSKVVGAKNALPILDNLLLKIVGNSLHVTASDLESTLSSTLELDTVEGEGTIAIDAKKILEILREFPEQPLNFNIDTESLRVDINSETGKYSLVGSNAEDFPQIPVIKSDSVNRIELPPDLLYSGISSAIFATGDDELRPVMNGIYVQLTNKGVNFVATDAHKLVRYMRKDISVENEASFILPKKPAGILKGILPKAFSNVTLEFDNKNAFFSFENFQLVCRLVEGVYPNYDTVIPKDNPNKLFVDRIELYNALKRVSVFANQASNLVALEISGNQLNITAQDLDYANFANDVVNCQYTGDEMQIGFKSNFLLDILNNIATTEVVIELSDPTRAGLILPKDNDNQDEDILMLIMPMMINS